VAMNPRNVLPKSKLGMLDDPAGGPLARVAP
jgi:hypothetical protein